MPELNFILFFLMNFGQIMFFQVRSIKCINKTFEIHHAIYTQQANNQIGSI